MMIYNSYLSYTLQQRLFDDPVYFNDFRNIQRHVKENEETSDLRSSCSTKNKQ